MATIGEVRQLSAIIGERLRAFREQAGLRQEDIADAMRAAGFNWGRSSVASLEGGNRDLSIGELVLFPTVVRQLGGWTEPLVPSSTEVKLNDSTALPMHLVAQLVLSLTFPSYLSDEVPSAVLGVVAPDDDARLGEIEITEKDPNVERRDVAERIVVWDRVLLELYPGRSREGLEWGTGGELVQTVADRLVTPGGGSASRGLVRALSVGLWGHHIGRERDSRADRRGTYESKRALQSARGHVTRELIEELQSELNARWAEIQAVLHGLGEVIDDSEKLQKWIDQTHKMAYRRARGKFRLK